MNREELRISWGWPWGHLAFRKQSLQEDIADCLIHCKTNVSIDKLSV